MPVERPRVPSSVEQISGLNPLESSSDAIKLQVSLSDKVVNPMEIKVPPTTFERIADKLKERGIEPKFVAAGAVVFVAAATAGVVAKKIIENRRKQSVPEPVSILTDGQKQEYEKMYQDSHELIYKFMGNRLRGLDQDVEDLTQKVFENAYKHFPPRFTYPELPNPYSPWLLRIAGNLVRNRYRDSSWKTKHETEREMEEVLLGVEEPGPDMDTIVTSREEASELQKAVISLRDPYPLLIWLKMRWEWSNDEIAYMFGTTEGAIKSTYFRALRSLRKIYSRSAINPGDSETIEQPK